MDLFEFPLGLRFDQCCSVEGCLRPRRHDDLCVGCYFAATPALRAACDIADDLAKLPAASALESLYRAPAFGVTA